MTEQEVRDGVNTRKWFHVIPLPYGIVTPGTREPDAWQVYKLPERLDGQTLLDIGAWDGQFSFEAERRGAEVTAMDLWNRPDADPGSGGYGWDNFMFAHRCLQSKVKTVNASVYDIPVNGNKYDMVLFLEVLYHLQDPLLGLKKVASICNKTLVLETWIDAMFVEQPAMIYYEGNELAGDPTNWWGPNQKCVEAMLRTVGFKSIEMVWYRNDVHFDGRGRRACFHAIK